MIETRDEGLWGREGPGIGWKMSYCNCLIDQAERLKHKISVNFDLLAKVAATMLYEHFFATFLPKPFSAMRCDRTAIQSSGLYLEIIGVLSIRHGSKQHIWLPVVRRMVLPGISAGCRPSFRGVSTPLHPMFGLQLLLFKDRSEVIGRRPWVRKETIRRNGLWKVMALSATAITNETI